MTEETRIKIVIVGEAGVGKTSLMQMYSEGTFSSEVSSTIGSTCTEKELVMNDQTFIISIWDTAGQESYRTIVPMYFRGASVAIIVFDVTNQKSLDSVEFWKETIKENLSQEVITILCANKIDLIEKRTINDDSIQVAAKNFNMPYFLTSAATGTGVNNMFEYCVSQVIKTLQKPVDEVAAIKPSNGCKC